MVRIHWAQYLGALSGRYRQPAIQILRRVGDVQSPSVTAVDRLRLQPSLLRLGFVKLPLLALGAPAGANMIGLLSCLECTNCFFIEFGGESGCSLWSVIHNRATCSVSKTGGEIRVIEQRLYRRNKRIDILRSK